MAQLLTRDPWRGAAVLRLYGPGLLATVRALPWYVRATPIRRAEWYALEQWRPEALPDVPDTVGAWTEWIDVLFASSRRQN